MALPKELPDFEILSKMFSVDEEGKLSKYGFPCQRRLYKGQRYLQTRIFGKNYKQHRVIMSLYLGRCLTPYEIVDHIDGDCLNNRRENLRCCSYSENSRNQSLSGNNKTGYAGVYLLQNTDGHRYYRAQWTDDATGKRVNRSFSISKYGEDEGGGR